MTSGHGRNRNNNQLLGALFSILSGMLRDSLVKHIVCFLIMIVANLDIIDKTGL